MNKAELARNPVLTDFEFKDLNVDPTIPYGDETFDVHFHSLLPVPIHTHIAFHPHCIPVPERNPSVRFHRHHHISGEQAEALVLLQRTSRSFRHHVHLRRSLPLQVITNVVSVDYLSKPLQIFQVGHLPTDVPPLGPKDPSSALVPHQS